MSTMRAERHINPPETASANYSAIASGSGFVVDDPGGALGDHTADHCDGCSISATIHVPEVTLTLSKQKMTLKHDNPCGLNVVTKPAGLTFTDHKIKIAFSDKQMEFTLANGSNYNWTTRVAGNFRLYAQATADGTVYDSTNAFAKVQFPHRDDIAADAGVVSAMEAAWQQTLVDSTTNQCRERGFIVQLDTRTGACSTDASAYSSSYYPPGAQAQGAHWPPAEEEITAPTMSGLVFTVALFHTHPPFEFAEPTQYPSRKTGPSKGSGEDIPEAIAAGLPGLLYDYSDYEIYAEHAETNSYKLYKYGPDRRVK